METLRSVLFTEDTYSERFVEFTTGFGATSATVYAYKHTRDSRRGQPVARARGSGLRGGCLGR